MDMMTIMEEGSGGTVIALSEFKLDLVVRAGAVNPFALKKMTDIVTEEEAEDET